MLKRLLVLSTLLVCAAGARAGVIVTFDSRTQTATGFDWVYDVTLEPGARMSPNDFFVVYDIPGLTGATWDPNNTATNGVPDVGDWQVDESAFGPFPLFAKLPDNPNFPNVLVTLQGVSPIVPILGIDDNGKFLGQLTVSTPIGTQGLIDFSSLSAQASGTPLFDTGRIAGPIPEPSTVGMMGAGLVALVVVALRRRRQTR
jgi:hypothetical protein